MIESLKQKQMLIYGLKEAIIVMYFFYHGISSFGISCILLFKVIFASYFHI